MPGVFFSPIGRISLRGGWLSFLQCRRLTSFPSFRSWDVRWDDDRQWMPPALEVTRAFQFEQANKNAVTTIPKPHLCGGTSCPSLLPSSGPGRRAIAEPCPPASIPPRQSPASCPLDLCGSQSGIVLRARHARVGESGNLTHRRSPWALSLFFFSSAPDLT